MDVRYGFEALVGNTPLVRLRQASEETGCTILGKCEFLNPGGSVKDRAALWIVEDAEARGTLRPGGVIVEGTAGNTGIGLALVANARGYRTVIVMPETQSQEKKDLLRQGLQSRLPACQRAAGAALAGDATVSETDLPTIVTTEWLAARLGAPDLRIVDATWFLATDARQAHAEFERAHVPGAVFFDIDAVADRTTDLPHMLPPPAELAAALGALGIGDDDRVVCYDAHGLYSVARVWWTLRACGHEAVAVLEGGLPRWRAEGRPLAGGPAAPAPAVFTARPRPGAVVAAADVRANLDHGRFQLVDVRPAGRFRGDEPEPRPGLRRGHVPGSRNVPWGDLLTPAGDALLPPAALRARLLAAGVDLGRPIVAACGSGVTSALLALALHVLGAPVAPIYDGSWAEWGALPDAPTAVGDA